MAPAVAVAASSSNAGASGVSATDAEPVKKALSYNDTKSSEAKRRKPAGGQGGARRIILTSAHRPDFIKAYDATCIELTLLIYRAW